VQVVATVTAWSGKWKPIGEGEGQKVHASEGQLVHASEGQT